MPSIRNTLQCNMYVERKKTKPMRHNHWAVKNPPAMQETRETQVWPLGQEDPLEKDMAIHSSILAWEFSWTTAHGPQNSRTQLSDWAQGRLSNINFSQFWRLGISRSNCQKLQLLVRTHFLVWRWQSSPCILTWQSSLRGSKPVWISSCKDINPIAWALPSWPKYLPKASPANHRNGF